MRAAPVQAAADAHCVVRTALLCVPTSSRLAIFRQAHIEHLAILFAAHQIADVSAEFFRQAEVRACADEMPRRVSAKKPSWKATAGQFALAVSRGNQEH